MTEATVWGVTSFAGISTGVIAAAQQRVTATAVIGILAIASASLVICAKLLRDRGVSR